MPALLRRFVPLIAVGAFTLQPAASVCAEELASSSKAAIERIHLHNEVIGSVPRLRSVGECCPSICVDTPTC